MLGKHRFGLYEKALDAKDDWRTRLQKAKDLGFDYMEISIDESDGRLNRLYAPAAELRELQNATLDIGLPFASMCLSAHRKYPFGSADAKTAAKARDIMERAIEFSLQLGIRVIQMAGYDVYYEDSTEQSRAQFMDGLKWAAKLAEQNQVMLGMEIMDTPFYNSITKHLVYEREVDSPWFKVYPDMGNLTAWGNDIVAELTKGIKSIVAMHIKETKLVTDTFPGAFRDVPYGEGDVDFALCFSTLEQLQYAAPYTLEMWHQPGTDDVQTVEHSMAYIKKIYRSAVLGERA